MYFCNRLRSEAMALEIVQSGWVGTHLRKRRLSTLCSLTARSLANSNLLSKTKQRVDVPLVCIYASSYVLRIEHEDNYITSRRGLCMLLVRQ